MRIEEQLIQKKTFKQIADFLGISEGDVSESLNRATPRKIINECNSYKDLLRQGVNDDDYTLADLDYIKEHDKSYFKYLLRNDYLNDDKIHTEVKKRSLERSEIDLAIDKTKEILSIHPFQKKNDIMFFNKSNKSVIYQRGRYLSDGLWRLKKNNREFTYYNELNKTL